MNGTKTLVILTVPGVGKTWYKDRYNSCIPEGNPMKLPLVFDMGIYDDKSVKEQELVLLNIIYITRKLHLDSIIMINGSKRLMGLMSNNDIPYVTLLPKNRYKYCKNNMDLLQNVMYMDNNSTSKRYFNNMTQFLFDKIIGLWNNELIAEDLWYAYDRKWRFV